MSIISTVDYDNPANFTFDPLTVEVSAVDSEARLLRNPDAATFLATLQIAGGDAEISPDAVAATINGNVTIAGSAAEIRDASSYIQWVSTNSDPGNVGAVRLVFTPQFTGSAPNLMTLFAFQNPSGGINASVVRVRLSTSNMIAEIYQNNQTNIVTITADGLSWVAGQSYEVELNWDIVAGATRLFLDGVQVGLASGATGTRMARDEMRCGSQIGAPNVPNFDLEGLQVFASVQHTAAYTARGVNLYSVAGEDVEANSTVESDGLLALAASTTIVGADEVRWIIAADGLDRYWDGAAWVSSDRSIAQSATLADTTANIAALDISAGADVVPVPILISDSSSLATAGDTTPRISQHVLTYDFFATKPDLVQCIVFGFVTGADEAALEGKTVQVENEPFLHGEHQIPAQTFSTKTDATGAWELSLIETASINLFPYNFRVDDTRYAGRQVPSTFAQSFGTLAKRTD